MLLLRCVVQAFTAFAMALSSFWIYAQDYPTKPIRIITSAPGGGTDVTARLIAPGISASLGQPVIVDNRAGVTIAAEVVSKLPPDGYSLLYVDGGSLWTAPLMDKTPYDPI